MTLTVVKTMNTPVTKRTASDLPSQSMTQVVAQKIRLSRAKRRRNKLRTVHRSRAMEVGMERTPAWKRLLPRHLRR